MKLTVIVFGKLKTPGMRQAADHYIKHLRTWAKLDEIELRSQTVPDKSEATRHKIQEHEADMLLAQMAKLKCPVYLLDEGGKSMTSLQWGEASRSWEPEAAFCIGSSLGFSERVRSASAGLISLGPQTLPHELSRVVLYEQLYRALSISHGHPYHNEGS